MPAAIHEAWWMQLSFAQIRLRQSQYIYDIPNETIEFQNIQCIILLGNRFYRCISSDISITIFISCNEKYDDEEDDNRGLTDYGQNENLISDKTENLEI